MRATAPTSSAVELSSQEIDALAYLAESGGMGDVWSPQLGRVLRDLHTRYPSLFDIVDAEPDRTGAKPFFGVVLTAAGRAALAEAKGDA